MRRRKLVRLLLLALVLTLLGLIGAVAWGTPRLLSASPADGAQDAPAGSALELTFSREMLAETVVERLEIQPQAPGDVTWQGNRLTFTPRDPWPPGATVQVKLRAGGRASRFPPLPLLQDFETSFTVRQPRLAFLYPSNGPANIFLHNPLTGAIDPLTNVFSGVLDFEVSPDGDWLYFSARNTQGGSDLYRLNLSRQSEAQPGADAPSFTQPEEVLTCPLAQCRAVEVSPEGDFLAFERQALSGGEGAEYARVWIMPVQTGGEPFLAGEPDHQTLQPAWASNGLLAYYDVTQAAYIITEPGVGERARFSNQTGQPGDWQPDGAVFAAAEITFLEPGASAALQNLERLADSHLLFYDIASGETQNLTDQEGIEDASPAFSPDGAYLAFGRKFLDVRQWSPGRQLWLMRLVDGPADGPAFQLTNDPLYNHFDFAWSPAGDRLAFVRFNQSTLTEPPEVWAMRIAPAPAGVDTPISSGAKQIITGGYAPQWIP